MGFQAIHDQNPFVVPAILLAVILLARAYVASRPGPYRPWAQKVGRKSIIVLSALLGVCVVLVPVFEAYFRLMDCQVSQKYMKDNVRFAHKAMDVFEQNHIPYWLDYATLLNELRGQQLNAWEQDVDFSTVFPTHLQSLRNMPVLANGETLGKYIDQAKKDPKGKSPALTVEDLMRKFSDAGFQVTFENKDNRMLIQCWGEVKHGPHIDVWLWAAIPEGTTGSPTPASTMWTPANPPLMWSGEERLSYNPRTYSHIFPLTNATWLGREVSVPADKHAVSDGEFGHYGGSYMTPQVFRGDCFHNFFQLRYFY